MGWPIVPARELQPGDLARPEGSTDPDLFCRVITVIEPDDGRPRSLELSLWRDVDESAAFEVRHYDLVDGEQ